METKNSPAKSGKPVAKEASPRRTHRTSRPNNKRKDVRHQSHSTGRKNNRKPAQNKTPQEMVAHIPKLAPGNVRIIPICGVEWIGTNMTAIEYGEEIIVVDAGFGFSTPDTPGINYTIPDVTYLEANKHKVKALVITHGHMDHVGGIPYVLDRIGNPPIYTREFGAMFIKNRLQEFPKVKKIANIHTVQKDDAPITIGENFVITFFGLTHSIPDATGVIIDTPLGGIVSTGDVRVENDNGVPSQEEVEQYKIFENRNILLMTCDSTGVIKPGWSISESVVVDTLDTIIKDAKGRLFIGSFSSQVERLLEFINSAKKYGKYVAIDGRSMKGNIGIAQVLELTDFDHLIDIQDIAKYPPNKIVVLVTGAQGEQYSVLDRLGRGEHKHIKLEPSDTIVLSSSVVPGNDHSVVKLKDQLYRGSYNIITYSDNQVHASGHGKREELLWIHKQVPYKFFMPIHGYHHMLKIHAKLVYSQLNVPAENIVVPENGSIVEIRENGEKIVKLRARAPHAVTVVDGTYEGPLHDVVIKDRKVLGENGMFVVVMTLDMRKRKLKKSPDIISRGFIYLRESQEMLSQVRSLVQQTAEKFMQEQKGKIEFDELKKVVQQKTSRYLKQKTDKEPIVIPVVLSL